MPAKMQDNYERLGVFYDSIVGDRKDSAKFVNSLIKEFAPDAKSLLEVACGTGSMLAFFQKRFSCVGIDYSASMLTEASEKVPDCPLFQGDMRDFWVEQKFDVVLCLFDSINHLLTISDWKKAFKSIRAHLEKGGIFIFDINSKEKLETMAKSVPLVHEFEGVTYILDVEKKGKNKYNWNARIFTPVDENYFLCIDETIPEATFTVAEIKKSFSTYFDSLKVIDEDGSKPKKNSERIYFVCRAK